MTGDSAPYYGRARQVGALLLIGTACLLVLIDAASDSYSADPVALGLMLGTAATLLAVEGARAILDRRG